MANNQRPHKYGLHAKFQTLTFETEAMVRSQSNVQTRFWGFVLYSKLWRLPPPAFVASSPPSSRPQAVAPRPLWRLPPPAYVASSPPSSRPQAVTPRPRPRCLDQDGYDAVGYSVFFSSTLDFDSFDEIFIFLLLYYYQNLNSLF